MQVEPITGIRRFALSIFLIGAIGSGTELLLLGHTENIWQLIPLLLIAASLVVLSLLARWHTRAGLRAFQGTMLLFIVSGLVGVLLHYRSNAEFELEVYPAIGGMELFWASLTGAMPALAPGTMAYLGLLGLLFTYQDPVFAN